MNWKLIWSPAAADDLEGMDRQVAQRTRQAVRRFAETNYGDVKKLAGSENEWRLRVGDWRVRFTFDGESQTIIVHRILPRGRAYRD